MNEILGTNYFQREVILYLGARTTAGALVADPDEMWRGVMENASVTKGRNGEQVVINCESELARLERSNNVLFTDANLQGAYSGDLFFQFLQFVPDMKPVWRGTNNNVSATGAPDAQPKSPFVTPL